VDNNRIDQIARVLGNDITRRGLVGALAGFLALDLGAAAKPGRAKGRGSNALTGQRNPTKPAKPEQVVICHKPGTPAERTLRVAAAAVAAHLRHGDRLGDCCDEAQSYVRCGGQCCPPPPQGGEGACCPDGSCGCAGACCAGACFLDDLGGDEPAVEFCCLGPEQVICPTPERKDTCCPADEVRCACAGSGGMAGSYRRPGR
jgi:hypothetical protein